MRFSLIVSTVGREVDLRNLLRSLAAQTYTDFEVIVVDQSQKQGIAAVVAEFADALAIRHVPMHGRGLSRGRNRGWAAARGEILNFPDDDCTWPPDHLARVAKIFDADPALDGLTTRVETMGRGDSEGGPIDRHNVFGRCVDFAFFVRRDRAGDHRYDEVMGVGAGTPWGADEGPDFMLRLMAAGLRLQYDPSLCIYHPDPLLQPANTLLARTLSYSRGRGYLLRKHRYGFYTVARSLVRSLGGAVLMLCTGKITKARIYWRTFYGKLIGYIRAGRPPQQVVETPLVDVTPAAVESATLTSN